MKPEELEVKAAAELAKQGFEIDGVEIKARMDFGAAAIDYRGLQKSAGA